MIINIIGLCSSILGLILTILLNDFAFLIITILGLGCLSYNQWKKKRNDKDTNYLENKILFCYIIGIITCIFLVVYSFFD